MLVKTLRDHSNAYGALYYKKTGDKYFHPNPSADIAAGIVEEASKNGSKSTRRRVRGNGGASNKAQKVDGKKSDKADDDSGNGADEGIRNAEGSDGS